MRYTLSDPERTNARQLRSFLLWNLALVSGAACASPEPDAGVCELLAESARQEDAARVAAGPASARTAHERSVSTTGVVLKGANLNGLHLNGANLNGLGLNGLQLNGLSINGLSVNGLSVNGAEAQAVLEFLGYAVSCALRADQQASVRIDGREELLSGSLGLAPAWETRGLDDSEERMLSACLLAHANALSEPVAISVRSFERARADEVEQVAFPVHEGAFFGSLSRGARFACYAEPPSSARSLSSDRELRRCTDDDSCGMTPLGACEEICDAYDPETGYHQCRADGDVYDEVVNVYLREDALVAACEEPG